MTRKQTIVSSLMMLCALTLHLVLEWDIHSRFKRMPEDPVLKEVKHEYASRCMYGNTIKSKFYTCDDIKKYINRYERKYAESE